MKAKTLTDGRLHRSESLQAHLNRQTQKIMKAQLLRTLALAGLLLAPAKLSGQLALDWFTVDGGAGTSDDFVDPPHAGFCFAGELEFVAGRVDQFAERCNQSGRRARDVADE